MFVVAAAEREVSQARAGDDHAPVDRSRREVAPDLGGILRPGDRACDVASLASDLAKHSGRRDVEPAEVQAGKGLLAARTWRAALAERTGCLDEVPDGGAVPGREHDGVERTLAG